MVLLFDVVHLNWSDTYYVSYYNVKLLATYNSVFVPLGQA